ncbi:MAG: helicase-exonuclease AddAB subunit AddA [Clostridia bacterium]|nr:helicase-exonuclease AddAB subunit AddA [Clostridia bacterium]
MSKPKTDFTPEQNLCIHSHGGTLLVSAAAGSGKTTVLVQRIIARITDPDNPVDIDRLLVVTFTRAAAAEMKHRLASKLSELIAQNPGDLRLQRQQLLLPRAAIETVDSFCGRLVRENFHLLDIPPQFRVGDEQQLSLLKKEALTEVLGEFYAVGDPDFRELASMLSDSRSDALLMSTVERLYDFLQPHPDPERWLNERAMVYEDPEALADGVWGRFVLDHIVDNLNKAQRLLQTALPLAESDANLHANYAPTLTESLHFIEQAASLCRSGGWDELLSAFRTYSTTRPGQKKVTDAALRERVKVLREEANKIIKKQAELMCGTDDQCRQDLRDTRRLVMALYEVTRQFSRRFLEKKKTARLLDFSDIEHYALDLLSETAEDGTPVPSPLAQELSAQFEEILVDEYQDTNALQDALYVALSRKENNLFFVGDVKQSIYGFRQAMPELFLRRRRAYPKFDETHYPGTITLGNNFRSRDEVTAGVNFAFRQLMSDKISGMRYDENEELKRSAEYPPANGHEPEFLIVDTTPSGNDKLEADVAEAEAVAKRIKELVGTLPVGSDSHPLRYNDCCVLLRSRRPAFLKVFEKHGIPVAADDAGAFFNTAEIRLALSLLRCINNPLQDVPLTAWLMSPLCGFTPDDMAAIRTCRPKTALYNALTAARSKAEDPLLAQRCRDAVAFLDRYRTLACQMTVDRLLLRLYEDTALPELMSARADGERRRHNLQLLQNQCHRFDQSGFRSLSAFIRYIDRLQAQNIELPGSTSARTENAVHIMTIHGSKGLEFPVVFLAGLGHEFNRMDLKNDLLLHADLGAGIKRRDLTTCNRYITLPHRALSMAIVDEECAEELRVLYVAMTRAREKLCLSMTLKNPVDKLSSLAATLDAQEALPSFAVRDAKTMGEWLLAALLRHPCATEWRRMIDREDLPLLSDENNWQFRIEQPLLLCETEKEEAPIPAAPDPTVVAQIRERMAYTYPHAALARIPVKLAASQTAEHTLQRRFVAQVRPAFLNAAGLTPAERGTAMHNFMLFADYTSAAADPEAEIIRLVSSGLLTAEQAQAIDRADLSVFFGSPLYQRMCRSPRLLREFPFTALCPAYQLDPALAEEDGEFMVMQGIADCVFYEDGELVIVDYKTDRVKTDRELLERYTTQLNIYRKSLSEALAVPVRDCLLYSFALGHVIRVEES